LFGCVLFLLMLSFVIITPVNIACNKINVSQRSLEAKDVEGLMR
jgi:hypothetical protein